jgi:hypothetical protein
LTESVRDGLLNYVAGLIDQNWFGQAFPERCPDGTANAGCDQTGMRSRMEAYGVYRPSMEATINIYAEVAPAPTDVQVFDLLEFSYENIALPKPGGWHDYFRHHHFDYDQAEGRARFADEVNRIFERSGMAFELRDGEITRLVPDAIGTALAAALFKTGDQALDQMLEDARRKFLNKDLKVQQESLEDLWDAWERLKTLEPAADKRASVKALLDKGSGEPTFRQVLEDEAVRLTKVGNDFLIRHTEVGKVPVNTSIQVDYLFQRLFSLVQLLLKASGRSA